MTELDKLTEVASSRNLCWAVGQTRICSKGEFECRIYKKIHDGKKRVVIETGPTISEAICKAMKRIGQL